MPPTEEERPFPIHFPSLLDNNVLGVPSNPTFSLGIILTFTRAKTKYYDSDSPTPILSSIRANLVNTSETVITSIQGPRWGEPFLFP